MGAPLELELLDLISHLSLESEVEPFIHGQFFAFRKGVPQRLFIKVLLSMPVKRKGDDAGRKITHRVRLRRMQLPVPM